MVRALMRLESGTAIAKFLLYGTAAACVPPCQQDVDGPGMQEGGHHNSYME